MSGSAGGDGTLFATAEHRVTTGKTHRNSATRHYVLQPAGNGTTLTNTVELTPPRPLRLLAPLATHRVSAAVASNLEVLKELLERE